MGAQAQLTGTLAVCAGTVGPGSVRLLNGPTTPRKPRPAVAICGQVPLGEIGSDFVHEVDDDQLCTLVGFAGGSSQTHTSVSDRHHVAPWLSRRSGRLP